MGASNKFDFSLLFVVNFNFMFRMYSIKPESKDSKEGLEMCLKTLRFMAKGGMYDHIAQVRKVLRCV